MLAQVVGLQFLSSLAIPPLIAIFTGLSTAGLIYYIVTYKVTVKVAYKVTFKVTFKVAYKVTCKP